MTTFSDMLEEMVVGILSRLPPKSLVRFRCVSKLWYTIINYPSFVAKHLSISRHNKFASATCILVKHTLFKDRSITDEEEIAALRKCYDSEDTDLVLSLHHFCNDDDGDGNNLSVAEELDVLFPSSINTSNLEFIGHCDGLICLSSYENDVLCNPAIREFKVLPESCVLYDIPPRAEDEDKYSEPLSSPAAMGFGFDSKAKEYKIVRIVDSSRGSFSSFTRLPKRAEVYTMDANSWRELENVEIGYQVFWGHPFVIHFKGICYWWATDPTIKEFLVTFDMSDEIFDAIPMPDCFDYDNDKRYRSLAVLKDSIVLLSFESDEVPKSFDLWMMDESTTRKGSWTKYLTFGPVEGIKFPLVFWNSEELLMVTNGSRLVSYNPATKKLHNLPIHCVDEMRLMQAVNYINSIIPVEETASLKLHLPN